MRRAYSANVTLMAAVHGFHEWALVLLLGALAAGCAGAQAPSGLDEGAPSLPQSSSAVPMRSAGADSGLGQVGVFLSVSGEQASRDADRYAGYDTAIVDLQEFNPDDVLRLRDAGVTRVYSYLNIGSLETYRPYYERFSRLIVEPYENWPDEYWLDVTDPQWRDFIVRELGEDLIAGGADGFFIDNADVYGRSPTKETRDALVEMLGGLKALGVPVLINGGDEFVAALLDEEDAQGTKVIEGILDGIAQETVFTSIEDYERDVFGRRDAAESTRLREYVERVADRGLTTLLIEYTSDSSVESEVEEYCADVGCSAYIARSVDLD